MRIAIVGAGISGLAAAWLLHREHDVTLFEAGEYLGGHTNTVAVATASGGTVAVDTGFIVYNERTYPLFCQLLRALGVQGQNTTMSFSVRCEQTGLEYRGADLNGFFAQRRNLLSWRFYRFLGDLVRFNRVGVRYLESAEELTVGEFFQRESFTSLFREKYFYPMAAAVWSCPPGAIEGFPIRFILEFYQHHGLLSVSDRPQWQVIQGGSQSYIPPLIRSFEHQIHLRTPVVGVARNHEQVMLQMQSGERFACDQVLFACHSDQALRILGEQATPRERELLSAFPYETNEVVLHTDTKLLPRSRRAWACWNYFLPAKAVEKATVTYNMNMLQRLATPETYCVTLNSSAAIDPARVLRRFTYHHPVFNRHRREMQERYAELVGPNRTSYCGAYWRNGFHEDGVWSALQACRPWLKQEGPWNHAFTRGASDIVGTAPLSMHFATPSP